jgi:hypothetical protein
MKLAAVLMQSWIEIRELTVLMVGYWPSTAGLTHSQPNVAQ